MADIRIKDLPTTATQTASDDFIALDGTVNGTRKIDASAPSFKTSVTSPSVVAPATTPLTLTGGSSGASLVLGATASGIATITTGTPTTGRLNVGAANIFVTGGSAGLWLNASGAFDVGAYEASGALRFRTGTADKMSLTSTGNLLIGTTTDINRLTVAQDAGGSDVTAGNGQVMIAGATNTNKRLAIGYNTTSDYGWMQAALLGTAYKPIAINPNGGNLLIGTTTDAASLAGGLVVNGSGSGATATGANNNTGALRVTGGVGVSGAGYFGGAVTSAQFASPTGGSSGGVISLTGANANIEMGTAGTTNTPFIDFHSSASSTDYDARIIASGGTASNGAGTLSLTAATINLPGTTSASSSTVGALTIGNGSAATNVAIGGGNVNAGGTLTTGGTVGVGIASDPAYGLYVRPSALTGTTQYAAVYTPVFTSAATLLGTGVYSRVNTAAAAFTLAEGYTYQAATPSLGAGSAITTQIGLQVLNQGAAGITNAVGIDIAAQSGAATTNIGLRNAGITSLTNATASTGSTSGALQVAGGIGVGGASVFGAELSVVRTTDAAAYLGGIELRTWAGAGSFYPGIRWHDTSLGTLARQYSYREGGSFATSMVFQTSIAGSATPTTALRLDSGQNAYFAGAATFAGAVTASGAVTGGIARATSWSLDNSLAYFGHSSAAGAAGTYAMLQSAAGNTQLNGTSTLTLGINNSPHLSLASGAATFAVVVIKKNYTVATLPAAASYTYGEAYVSDATQAAGTSLGSAPTGGGSVKRGVYSDGSSWLLR